MPETKVIQLLPIFISSCQTEKFLIFLQKCLIEMRKEKEKKNGKQFTGKCVDRREAGKNPAGLRSLFSVVTRFCERFGAVSTHSVAESEFDRTEPNYTGRSPR